MLIVFSVTPPIYSPTFHILYSESNFMTAKLSVRPCSSNFEISTLFSAEELLLDEEGERAGEICTLEGDFLFMVYDNFAFSCSSLFIEQLIF